MRSQCAQFTLATADPCVRSTDPQDGAAAGPKCKYGHTLTRSVTGSVSDREGREALGGVRPAVGPQSSWRSKGPIAKDLQTWHLQADPQDRDPKHPTCGPPHGHDGTHRHTRLAFTTHRSTEINPTNRALVTSARLGHAQTFFVEIYNPASVTQTILGLADDSSQTAEPDHLTVSETRTVRGDAVPARYT